MKALTLLQPWATLAIIGAKRVETRSWFAGYRGLLAVHASAGEGPELRALCDREPFRAALSAEGYHGWQSLPRAAVLGVMRLADCRIILPAHYYQPGACWWTELPEQERAFGDFSPDRWGWVWEVAERFPAPIPAKGARGLWDWEDPQMEGGRFQGQFVFGEG